MTNSHAKTVKKKSRATVNVGGLKISVRRISSGMLVVLLTYLILGILAGGFVINTLTKDDDFALISLAGQNDIEIENSIKFILNWVQNVCSLAKMFLTLLPLIIFIAKICLMNLSKFLQ